MADDNQDQSIQKEPEATKPKPEAKTAETKTAETKTAEAKTAETKTAETAQQAKTSPSPDGPDAKAASPLDGLEIKKSPAEIEKAFQALDEQISKTDWGWKPKVGVDREIGRLSYIQAQNRWVEAATGDHKRASDVWYKATRRNPSAEMEANLKKVLASPSTKSSGQKSDMVSEMDSLAVNMEQLSKRRDLSENKTRKTALSASLGEWNVMRGDSQKRAQEAAQARRSQLISAEPNKADDGLHLLKSFYKGFESHRLSTQTRVENNKAKLAGKALRGIHKQIGSVSAEIKRFETELDVPMDERDTSGLVGRSRKAVENNPVFRRGAGAATVLAKVTKKVGEKTGVTQLSKKTGEFAKDVAKGLAVQSAAALANPGAIDGNPGKASYEARMANFHRFQRSQGMGGPGN